MKHETELFIRWGMVGYQNKTIILKHQRVAYS